MQQAPNQKSSRILDAIFELIGIQPPQQWKTSFAKTFAGPSGYDPDFWNLIGPVGTNQSVSQSGGNLVLSSGQNVNAETILRSKVPFNDQILLRWQLTSSSRIINQDLFVELVDVIGDGLAYTINSATSVTISAPNHSLTAANVGQSITIADLEPQPGIPGRYVIASIVPQVSITLTVAGWPASGSGTCSLFGLNHEWVRYTGATATQAAYDTARGGWASGETTATINTTASPGHIGIMLSDGQAAALFDMTAASATSIQTTQRASRALNVPSDQVPMYLQIRMRNGSTAPASSITWSLGFAGIEQSQVAAVSLANSKPMSAMAALAVQVLNTVTATVTGAAAQGATASGNPVLTGAVAKTAQPTARTDGQIVAPLFSKVGHAITMVGQVRDLNDTNAPVTLTTTTETTLVAAVASTFNDLYGLTLVNTSATGVRVDLRSTTAGAIVDSFWLPPTSTIIVSPNVPYKQATVNTNWTVQLSAAVTDVRVSARTVRNI